MQPGELVAARAGIHRVRLEATFAAPGFQAAGSLEVDVEVHPGGVSEISLPLDAILQAARWDRPPGADSHRA